MRTELSVKKIWAFLFLTLIVPVRAYAYIDPGSGGYLVGSAFPMIAGIFAVIVAFFAHFFRHTLNNFFKNLWNKRRRNLNALPDHAKFDGSLSGAHLYDASAVADGYNLFDGRLIDREGRLVKKWRNRYLGVLLPDGRYVAQEYYESQKWGLFTWDDKAIWEMDLPIHHDIVFTPQKTLLTFTKEMHSYRGRNVDFCVIVEFDLTGRELVRWSTWEHFQDITVLLSSIVQKFFSFLNLPGGKNVPHGAATMTTTVSIPSKSFRIRPSARRTRGFVPGTGLSVSATGV
jgi:hypothetical protein